MRLLFIVVALFLTRCVQEAPKPQVTLDVNGTDCAVCHGTNNRYVMTTGFHDLHVSNATFGGSTCEDCHHDDRSSHSVIDSIVLMKDEKPLTTTTVCSGCHGSGAEKAKTYWKKPAGTWLHDGNFCESCHDGSSIVKSKQAKNIMAYYAPSGHGNTKGYAQTLHGKNGPGYRCDVCHDPNGPGHFAPSAGDSLLRINNGSSALCLDCHAPTQQSKGKLGYVAFSKAAIHSSRISKRFNYNFECKTCHDPHGTKNLAMIRESIDGGLGAGPETVNFTDSSMFSVDSVKNGACDACHAPGKDAHANTGEPGNHRFGRACWDCHFHSAGFDTIGFLSNIVIDPNPVEMKVASSLQLTAQALTNLNGAIDFTSRPVWSSGNPMIVTVNALGNLNGISPGNATVYVRYSGLTDSVSVQVNP